MGCLLCANTIETANPEPRLRGTVTQQSRKRASIQRHWWKVWAICKFIGQESRQETQPTDTPTDRGLYPCLCAPNAKGEWATRDRSICSVMTPSLFLFSSCSPSLAWKHLWSHLLPWDCKTAGRQDGRQEDEDGRKQAEQNMPFLFPSSLPLF